MGIRIFLHSIGLVFNQMGGALRISGLLYVIYAVASFIGLMMLMPSADGSMNFSWQMGLTWLLSSLLFMWIAVGWHRFVLLDERPTAPVPVFHGDRMLAYLGRILQTIVVLGVAGVVVFGVSFVVAVPLALAAPIVAMLPSLIGMMVLLVIGYRLAPLLPGAAIGRPVDIGTAWEATSGASGTILVLAAVSTICSIIIDLPAHMLIHLPAGQLLVLGWFFATTWVKTMVGISILTTIFGVFVEKRALA